MTYDPDLLAYAAQAAKVRTLEEILTSPTCFGLTTAAPLQRIACRAAAGIPLGELASAPLLPPNASDYPEEVQERATLEWALGAVDDLPVGGHPAEFYLLASVRSGKSLLTAALGTRAARYCDVSRLGPGDVPRVSVVSLKLDLATVIYQHALGRISSSPVLREWLHGDPTADTITIRHHTGIPVEFKTVAGARAGGSLVARWSAGAFFDEFPRMTGSADGKTVNFDHEKNAVAARLLPGAQLVGLGSPWAPFGPAFEVVEKHWRRPTPQVVVVRAVAPAMYPEWWTPERVWRLKQNNPIAYQTDVLGEFADPEASMFTAELLKAVTRAGPIDLPPQEGHFYAVAIDPATRSHAWTMVVLTRNAAGRLVCVLARQWRGKPGKPLSPDAVLREIAGLLEAYNVRRIVTDQWAADALRDLGFRHGLYLNSVTITASMKVDLFDSLQALVIEKLLELPALADLQDDLRRVAKKVTQAGVTIELPVVAGRHCDFAAALALAAAQPIGRPTPPPELDDGNPITAMLARRRERRGTWLPVGEDSWLLDEPKRRR